MHIIQITSGRFESTLWCWEKSDGNSQDSSVASATRRSHLSKPHGAPYESQKRRGRSRSPSVKINRLRKAWGLNRGKGRPRRASSQKKI